jgi:hypothetical protein
MNSRFLLLLLCLPCKLDAQITGVVRTSDGAPVVAEVELWAPMQRVARQIVDREGNFSFTQQDVTSATAIVFSQLGYNRVLKPIQSADTTFNITLRAAPTELDPVTATAARLCPNRADPHAEAVLIRLRSSYRSIPSGSFVETAFTSLSDVVAGDQLGRTPERPLRYEMHGRLRSAASLLNIARDGYARPAGTRLVAAEQDSWEYAPLGNVEADHFITEAFASSHTLSLGDVRPDGSFDIVFCPKQRKKPDVQGTLSLTTDTLLYEARWRFLVPKHEEFASGSALFAPPKQGSVTHLVPLSSVFVRQHRMPGEYFQKIEHYGIWGVSENGRPSPAVNEWWKTNRATRK